MSWLLCFPSCCVAYLSLQCGALLRVDILPLPNTFCNTSLPQYKLELLNTTHMETSPGSFCVLSPPRCLENLTFLQKRSAHILSSLDQGKRRIWQGRSYGSSTHKPGPKEQNTQAGMLLRFIWLLFLAFDDTV